jgi:3-keto-5-aminohexanoate cleavage enzyme
MTTDVQSAPLMISAAITGGHAAASVRPEHPLTPRQIVADAMACADAGAAIVHIHARRETGETTMDPAVYRWISNAIRDAGCDVLLDFSAGDDGGRASHAERIAVVDTDADIVSFAGGSFNIGDRLYDNRPQFQRAMAAEMMRVGVRPEIEVFESAQIDSASILRAAGLQGPLLFQFVCGLRGTLQPDWRLIDLLRSALPPGSLWSISAQTGEDVGAHAALLSAAIAYGGHVRTGFEDMRLMNGGEPAASNAALVSQWAVVARQHGRPIASPAEARRLMSIPTRGATARETETKQEWKHHGQSVEASVP